MRRILKEEPSPNYHGIGENMGRCVWQWVV